MAMVAIRYALGNSDSLVRFRVAACYHEHMDVYACRIAHLERAIASSASRRSLADMAGLSEKYLSQILTGYQGSKDRQPRRLGDKVARKIEVALGWPPGTMDHPIPKENTGGEALLYPTARQRLRIPRLEVVASMGNGNDAPAHDDVVEVVEVNAVQLRTHLGNTPVTHPTALRLISAYGDSMAPTFVDGDVLLVDTGVQEIRLDAVFVLSYRDELFIKRLQRRPAGVLRMLSDNKVYDPIDIPEAERDTFRVLGRVLLAWNARKL
jgi:hypothetical protein